MTRVHPSPRGVHSPRCMIHQESETERETPMFTLSHIRPDGTAEIFGSHYTTSFAATRAAMHLILTVKRTAVEAREFSAGLLAAFTRASGGTGAELAFEPTGDVYRIDPAVKPPNVCPCCKALVRPGVHAFAGQEDALCLGCLTWQRGVDQCLPANSAHPEGYVYDPDKE